MHPLVERVVGSTNTTTAANIESQQVPPGEVWELGFACLYNESGEPVTVSWLMVDGTRLEQLTGTDQVANNDSLPFPLPLPTLPEGAKLRAKVTGVAQTGKVTLILTGRRWPSGAVPGG